MSRTQLIAAYEDIIRLCPAKVTYKKMMFGCPVVFVNKKMFAGIYRNSIFIRVGEHQKREIIERALAKPFKAKGREMKEYVHFPCQLQKIESSFPKFYGKQLKNI